MFISDQIISVKFIIGDCKINSLTRLSIWPVSVPSFSWMSVTTVGGLHLVIHPHWVVLSNL